MAIFSGIAAAIGGLLGGSFLAGVGGFLLKTAVGIGLNLLAQSIAGKPKEPVFSINGQLQGGGDLPRSFILGRTATAGSLVWVNTWGRDGDTPNAYLTQVIALSDLPVTGLRKVWVNSEPVTLTGSNSGWGYRVPEFDNEGGNLWIKFYDGTQTTADTFLVNTCSNYNRQWDRNRIGRGVAYAIVTARVSKQMFSGIPNFKFELDGLRLYDIAKDSSAGGNGTHRWSDPSTWGGDGDHLPAVQAYNLLRGLRWNNEWFYGVQGMAAGRLPAADWIHAINKCRAPIQGVSGAEPTYRAGGEVTVDAPLANALEALNTACQGRIPEIGGTYLMTVGAPDAPVAHFTDDDIISTDGQSFTPFFGLADTINGVSATYPAPEDGWVVKSAPPIHRTDLEAAHGNRRLMAAVELNFVPYAEQVQRLMKSALEEAQRARRHTIVLPPRFWAYATPGAIFSWSSARNGYTNKLMRVDGVLDRANLDVQVDLTEVDPSDYDWDSGTDFKPPVDGALGALRPQPQPIVDFYAEAGVAVDSNGNNRRCSVVLGWDGSKDDIDLLRFELRLVSTLGVIYTGRTEDVRRGWIEIAPGILLPNTEYEVRATYGTYAGNRMFEWSDWIRVRTKDIRLGALDIYPISIDQLNKDVSDVLEFIGGGRREIEDELERIGQLVAEQDSGNFADKQELRRELVSSLDAAEARYDLKITAATGPDSALVARIETLTAQVNDDIATAVDTLHTQITDVDGRVSANTAAITSLKTQVDDDIATAMDLLSAEITTVDGRVTANAGHIQALLAEVDGLSSSVTMRAEAHQSTEDGWAVWGVQVKTGSSGGWSQAALYIETRDNLSRMVMNADQFIITNGEDSTSPFTFINGAAAMQVANIGEVTAGVIRSPDGRFVINLDEGYLRISDG
ncbi:phage tail protein [Pseudochrobactrum sp. HB0163]|uniref:phage tail protein n=1 Tax=Pseudochrobactrum sp. HB0163 TaxID=3450708 RepID=UPI003F6DEA1E